MDVFVQMPSSIPRRAFAAGLHLLASALVAAIAALLVFRFWYPTPFAAISGGIVLFWLIVCVDVVLGPALTAVVAAPGKPIAELRRDLMVIVLLQTSAFIYGIYSLALARPVWIAFEVDRFRVVVAADIDASTLAQAPPELQALSWTGPKVVAAVKPSDPEEQVRSIELGLAGFDLSLVPRNWRQYSTQRAVVWNKARPVSRLLERYPALREDLSAIASTTGQSIDQLRFLPLVGRGTNWIVLIGVPDARVIGYLPVDGFL